MCNQISDLKMPKKSPYPDLLIPEISLSDYIFSYIQQYGDDVALVDNGTGQTLTYSEICSQARKCASALFQHGLRKGDVVAICAPNCVEYPVIILATAACGAATTICNPTYTEGEMLHQFSTSEPSFVFTQVETEDVVRKVSAKLPCIKHIFILGEDTHGKLSSFKMLLRQARETDLQNLVSINAKEDLVLLPYSSGTTGLPKCVMYSHYSLVSSLKILSSQLHMFRSCCFYSDRPMFHIGGLLPILGCLQTGTKLIIDKNFDMKTMLNAIQTHKVTHTFIVPPIMIELSQTALKEKYDTSSLLFTMYGGSSVPEHLLTFLRREFNAACLQIYGLTECMVSLSDPVINHPNSSGTILSNMSVKIQDLQTGEELSQGKDGEILVKGPQNMIGYLKNPEATAETMDEEGWLHTGDIGHYDKDGMLYVIGRIKEVIKYKTFQVPPAELESVLLKHPKIADVGVIGVPDNIAGELPRAFVVRKDASLTKDEVKEFVAGELSDYKHLRGGVQFVDSIPKSILGKILRQDLKKLLNVDK